MRITLFALLLLSLRVSAQKCRFLIIGHLRDLEIRMAGLGERMILSFDEKERLSSGYHFIKHMNYALRINGLIPV